MIPVIEFSGWLSIIIPVIFLSVRLLNCYRLYDRKFVVEIVTMALLTSIAWFIYAKYKNIKMLHDQFGILIGLYSIILIAYFIHTCFDISKK